MNINPEEYPKIKPCPFCGSKAGLTGECDMVWVKCSNYDCQAERINKFDEPEEAIEDWNKRTAYTYQRKYEPTEDFRRIDDIGRVAIPKHIREILGITEGDNLEFILYPSAGGMFLKPIKP